MRFVVLQFRYRAWIVLARRRMSDKKGYCFTYTGFTGVFSVGSVRQVLRSLNRESWHAVFWVRMPEVTLRDCPRQQSRNRYFCGYINNWRLYAITVFIHLIMKRDEIGGGDFSQCPWHWKLDSPKFYRCYPFPRYRHYEVSIALKSIRL